MRTYSVRVLHLDQTRVPATSITLFVDREDPLPGVEGLMSWQLVAMAEHFGADADMPVATMELDDGRRFSGSVIETHNDGQAVTWQGSGELRGYDRSELDQG